MPSNTHAVRFVLVDPVKLAATHHIETSIAMTVTALVQGNSSDTDSLTERDGSRLINRNIARMTHFKTHAATIEKAATEPGTGIHYFCSRCGRKFRTNDQCRSCGIGFRLESEMGGVVGSFPGIPARVVAYAKQNGHVFTTEPPRA